MDIIWYILIGIVIIIIIYITIRLLSNDKFTTKSYLSQMIKLQNKQVALTSKVYNMIGNDNAELKNVADFIMQNIPPTTKIMEGLIKNI